MFNLSSFLAYIFITAYTPGPNNIMSMSNASRFGFKKSFPFNLGIFIGFLAVMILCMLLSSIMYTLIPKIKIYMLIIGAGYMLFLAWKTFKGSSKIEDMESSNNSFISGALLQFINPKIIIYGITCMSSYILPSFDNPLIIFAFAILLAFVGFTGTMCWALFGTVFKKIFAEHSKIVNTIMSILLIYCAISLFIS